MIGSGKALMALLVGGFAVVFVLFSNRLCMMNTRTALVVVFLFVYVFVVVALMHPWRLN